VAHAKAYDRRKGVENDQKGCVSHIPLEKGRNTTFYLGCKLVGKGQCKRAYSKHSTKLHDFFYNKKGSHSQLVFFAI